MPYLSIDDELGEDEDVDRFPVPQGMFTPRISVIRCKYFSGFRIDFSIEKCLYVTEFSQNGFSRQNQLGFQNYKRLSANKCATHSATRLPHLESEYFQSLQKRRSNENLLHGRNSSYSSCEVPDILFVVNVVGHFMLSL